MPADIREATKNAIVTANEKHRHGSEIDGAKFARMVQPIYGARVLPRAPEDERSLRLKVAGIGLPVVGKSAAGFQILEDSLRIESDGWSSHFGVDGFELRRSRVISIWPWCCASSSRMCTAAVDAFSAVRSGP